MKVLEKLREPNKQLRFPVQEMGDGDMPGTIIYNYITTSDKVVDFISYKSAQWKRPSCKKLIYSYIHI